MPGGNHESKKNNIKNYKNPEVDLRKFYTIHKQIGLILTLLLFIGLVKIELKPNGSQEIVFDEREEVMMEEIIQTRQTPAIPPPPRPPVPVAVPNHEIIEDIDLNIDAELDFSAQINLPPPPPAAVEEEEDEEDFFVVVEQMPELIGGLASLQSQIRYPEMARQARIQGRVIVQFIVNERGEVENPQVIRGIGGGADEEALRVVKNAKFTPGLQRGRPVRVQYSMPIHFQLRD